MGVGQPSASLPGAGGGLVSRAARAPGSTPPLCGEISAGGCQMQMGTRANCRPARRVVDGGAALQSAWLRGGESGCSSSLLTGAERGTAREERRRMLGVGQGSCRGSKRAATVAGLFEPPNFDPNKLMVRFMGRACSAGPAPPAPRRYTLTHNDLTGRLWLAVGSRHNISQIDGFYSRFLRDEVLAEWQVGATGGGCCLGSGDWDVDSLESGAGREGRGGVGASLHIHCHVSGGDQWWLIPAGLRYKIFRREMPLVLDTFRFAERSFLAEHPNLWDADVWVHFHSADPTWDRTECWGPLSTARGVEYRDVPKCEIPVAGGGLPSWHQAQWYAGGEAEDFCTVEDPGAWGPASDIVPSSAASGPADESAEVEVGTWRQRMDGVQQGSSGTGAGRGRAGADRMVVAAVERNSAK